MLDRGTSCIVGCTADLDPTQRAQVVGDFSKAKASISRALQTKLACYDGLLFLQLLGLAHFHDETATKCAGVTVELLESFGARCSQRIGPRHTA